MQTYIYIYIYYIYIYIYLYNYITKGAPATPQRGVESAAYHGNGRGTLAQMTPLCLKPSEDFERSEREEGGIANGCRPTPRCVYIYIYIYIYICTSPYR